MLFYSCKVFAIFQSVQFTMNKIHGTHTDRAERQPFPVFHLDAQRYSDMCLDLLSLYGVRRACCRERGICDQRTDHTR